FINQSLELQEVATEFKDGLRVTTHEVLSVTTQTLIGQVNPSLVNKINQFGIQSIDMNGIDAQLFDIKPLDLKYGFVCEHFHIDTRVNATLTQSFLPHNEATGVIFVTHLVHNINHATLSYKIAQGIYALNY